MAVTLIGGTAAFSVYYLYHRIRTSFLGHLPSSLRPSNAFSNKKMASFRQKTIVPNLFFSLFQNLILKQSVASSKKIVSLMNVQLSRNGAIRTAFGTNVHVDFPEEWNEESKAFLIFFFK